MRIITEPKYDFDDVLIVPKRSNLTSRSEVDLTRGYQFKWANLEYRGVPIVASNMSTTGTFEMVQALAPELLSVCLHKHYTADDLIEFYSTNNYRDYTWYCMGINDTDVEKYNYVKTQLFYNTIRYVCIDIANGYMEKFVDFVKNFREQNPDTVLIAGSVVTPEITEQLILAGADIVRLGIGSGANCTTRLKTGVGYPQLSAVIECADAAHGLGGHVLSDGGCRVPADIVKAFAGGADFVMLGGMLAGTDQCNTEIIEKDGKKYALHYGMSSKTANDKFAGGLKTYRSSEGRTTYIPYKGDVRDVVQDIQGGIRSACSYVGAFTLKELSKRTTFIRVNQTHNNVYEKYTVGE